MSFTVSCQACGKTWTAGKMWREADQSAIRHQRACLKKKSRHGVEPRLITINGPTEKPPGEE